MAKGRLLLFKSQDPTWFSPTMTKLVLKWMVSVRESLFHQDDSSFSESIYWSLSTPRRIMNSLVPYTLDPSSGTMLSILTYTYMQHLPCKPKGALRDNQYPAAAAEHLLLRDCLTPHKQTCSILNLIGSTPCCSSSFYNACPWES